jgi:hypothetical protein
MSTAFGCLLVNYKCGINMFSKVMNNGLKNPLNRQSMPEILGGVLPKLAVIPAI